MVPPGFQPAVVASRSVPGAALVSTQSANVTRLRRRAAVGVGDGERARGGTVGGGADHAEDGAAPGYRDGLAVGDHVVGGAGRGVRPGDREPVVQQRLAGRQRVRGQAGRGERVADAVVVPGRGIRRRRDADVVEGLLQAGRRRGRGGRGGRGRRGAQQRRGRQQRGGRRRRAASRSVSAWRPSQPPMPRRAAMPGRCRTAHPATWVSTSPRWSRCGIRVDESCGAILSKDFGRRPLLPPGRPGAGRSQPPRPSRS